MRSLALVIGVAVLVGLALAPARAEAQLTGQIITSDQPLPDPSGDTAKWVKELKKLQKTTFTKEEGGGWTVHFLAFLKKAPGTNEVNLVFYDVTQGKPDQVHYVPFSVTAAQKTLKSQLKLSADDPIKAGRKYEVRLTRVVGNKEDVLARVTLTFK
ncbi:MAG TPA: hypothetical protein VGQ83_05375 [Polyangia bacterium]|jgi:hypothetical protein